MQYGAIFDSDLALENIDSSHWCFDMDIPRRAFLMNAAELRYWGKAADNEPGIAGLKALGALPLGARNKNKPNP